MATCVVVVYIDTLNFCSPRLWAKEKLQCASVLLFPSALSIYCGGGGGGTFIAKDRTPLCVTGGDGSLIYNVYPTIQSHACGQSTQLSANFGSGQATLKMGGKGSGSPGGGRFEENGSDGSDYGKGGISLINGGAIQTSGTYGVFAYG
jgi:hypothetical protein